MNPLTATARGHAAGVSASPARARRRHLFAAVVLAAAAAGCATPPGPDAGGAIMRPPGQTVPVRVVDEHGDLSLRPSDAVARRLGDRTERDLLAEHLAHVEGALAVPLSLGNEARLLIDGPQTHRAMFRAIGRARRHIHLESYILETGEPGERLAALLAEKRAEGVEVRVLYDSVGSIATPPEYFERLRAGGAAVCEFNPVNPLKAARGWRINNRDHRKLLIVDGTVAFTGGVNISHDVYSDGSFPAGRSAQPRTETGWRDTHVQVEGPAVAEFERLFIAGWQRQRCQPALAGRDVPPPRPRGDKAMRLVAADPEAGRSEFYVALLSAIDHARRRVWLTYGYFVPDPRMRQALAGAARRGIDVRLVLPGFSDFWAPFHAGRSHYDELLAAGVRILERRDALLHAKTAVIDGVWSSIGSTNLDWRSFVHNYEADVLVLDPAFGREMEQLFHLDEEAAHEVRLADWRRRGLVDRLLEWVARRWAYLL